jgi:hypothetical protein
MALQPAGALAPGRGGLTAASSGRVAFGLALIGAAAASRLPKTLRILGAFIVVAGIVTPFSGVERTQAIVDWWAAQGTTFMQGWAAFALIFGLFIVYAVTPRRARRAQQPDRTPSAG